MAEGGGGQVRYYSYKKGVGKGFSHAEGGGHKQFQGSLNTGAPYITPRIHLRFTQITP